ncbi:MAG: DegT/DnrJ/EryC1/StrS aminotransferase family protein [Bacteroidia bacterium]|nr:DegT/DnrJ/EryC1/StrS aminotransferase family protein [Bacteroidia bacterium]
METTLREIAFGKPIIGENEKKAVLEVLEGPILVHGKRSKKFEDDFKAFTGASIAVSLSSCTAGLHLCYFHMGLKQGDEVIVPAQTHTATVHAVEYCGAKPVFIDAELETGNIDIAQIEEKITEKQKRFPLFIF